MKIFNLLFGNKPKITVDAIQWTGKNFDEVMNFMQDFHGNKFNYENAEELAYKTKTVMIRTNTGITLVNKNDWIIKDEYGRFYPCKRYIFKNKYTNL